MNCSDIRNYIDDYIDGYLNESNTKMVVSHIAQCPSCRGIFQCRKELIQIISSTKSHIPEPSPDLVNRIIRARKSQKNAYAIKRRNWSIGIAAIAASFIIFAILPGLGPLTTHSTEQKPLQTSFSFPTLHEPHTIGLLFKSKQYLENVTFSIEIPPEMELKGFPGKKKLKWSGSLRQGKNLISIPVIALSATSGIMTMSLEHVKTIKTFKVRLEYTRDKDDVSLRLTDSKVT